MTRCSEGPDRCVDDLCRGADVGLCGALSDRLLGLDVDTEEPYDSYDDDGWEADYWEMTS